MLQIHVRISMNALNIWSSEGIDKNGVDINFLS